MKMYREVHVFQKVLDIICLQQITRTDDLQKLQSKRNVTSSEFCDLFWEQNLYREVYETRFYYYFKAVKIYHVYILKCSDKTYYTGITSDLEKRVESHQSGKYKDSYTSSRRPLKLVYHCDFTEAVKAIEVEKQIKKWSRAKKQALILGEFEHLPNLSKKKFK